MKTARVLIVAGSDSGGGAGIQADLKTVTMLGGHGMTAITALTAQNTLGVTDVMPVPTDMVLAQFDACVDDIGVDAVKIGMIGSAETAAALARRIGALPAGVPVVFDPVMIATSGASLADAATIAAFGQLMRLATVVTPNRPELEALGGRDAVLAHGCALLEKGGHAAEGEGGNTVTDKLWLGAGESASWSAARVDTPHTHGTGCTLASAVATGLAQGLSLQQATDRARLFVRLALRDAPGLGGGHGPMGHQHVREDALVPGLSLNQITLAATDYAESVAFWRAFGLTQIVDSPDNGYARFEADNGVTLSIHFGEGSPGSTVYFEVQDLTGTCARLERAGIALTHQPRFEPWNWQEARLTDPAGNTICLYRAGEHRRYPPWRIP